MYQFGFDQEIRVAWSDMRYGFIVGSALYIIVGNVKNLGGFYLCLLVVWSVRLTGKAGYEAGRAKTNRSLQRQTRTREGKTDPTGTNWNCTRLSPAPCESAGDL